MSTIFCRALASATVGLLVAGVSLHAQPSGTATDQLVLRDPATGNNFTLRPPTGSSLSNFILQFPDMSGVPSVAGILMMLDNSGGSAKQVSLIVPTPNSVLVTGSSGPSYSAILPSGLTVPSPTITNPTINGTISGSAALTLEGDVTGSSGSNQIAAGAVTPAKINASGAAAGAVLTYNGTNVVWSSGGGATGTAGGDLTGTYPNPTIANSAVTSVKIADSTITSADIAANAAIPYSKLTLTNSITNGDLTANSVTTSKVANGTVTTSKMADSAISGLKLLTFAVTNRHLAANAVTPDKIDPTGATTGNVLTYNGTSVVWGAGSSGSGGATGTAGGDLTGSYPNPTVANDAITSAKIADGNVNNQDLAVNSVTTSKVANGTVTTSKMADSAISGLKLLTFAVTNRHLADGAVTTGKISGSGANSGDVLTYNGTSVVWTAPNTGGGGSATGTAGGDLTGTYPNPTIANSAVTSAKIADSTITSADIAANAAIPYSKLTLTNSVANGDLTPNSVTTSKVANGTVTTSKMADSAISGLKLLTFAVTNRHIADGAVTPSKVSTSGASSGNVLVYNGTNVVWGTPTTSRGTVMNHTVTSATTYTIGTTDDIVGCDVSTNGITITLPAASGVPAGKMLIIRVENGDASVAGRAVTINRNGTDLINYGQTSLTINQGTGTPATAIRLYSDGVNQWWQY